jgi:1-acyl-sn-glycerol-3-phosphate acyltransferase
MIAARSYLFSFYIAFVTGVMGLALLPALIDRRFARSITTLWAKVVLSGLKIICGLSFRVLGAENIPRGGAIVAVNHQSMWETVALIALLARPAMVLKKELLRVPVYGWWAARTGVPIDRNAGAKALRRLRRETKLHIARGDQIVVFPEGTRGPPGELGALQPGVAGMYLAADAPVTPVVHNSGEFWLHPSGRKSPGSVTIRFLPPIPPNLPRRDFMHSLEAALRQKPAADGAS